jgi:thiopurine S-methyltransferase
LRGDSKHCPEILDLCLESGVGEQVLVNGPLCLDDGRGMGTAMAKDFWQERWDTGQIGFHRAEPNDFLVRYIGRLTGGAAARIFVPLAGKSVDVTWLAERDHRVVACELVERAVEDYFHERHVVPHVHVQGRFTVHEHDEVRYLCGDIFDVKPLDTGPVDAIFDRAALVALPPQLQVAYVETLLDLLPRGGRILLVTFAYDQSRIEGPPWSIDDARVHALYDARTHVEKLEERDEAMSQKYVDAGVTSLKECAYLITKL